MSAKVLHETPFRLRVALPEGAAALACESAVRRLDGVQSTRLNRRLAVLVIAYDGREGLRAAVLDALDAGVSPNSAETPVLPAGRGAKDMVPNRWVQLAPVALAAAVPWLGGSWRTGAAVAAVALRVAAKPQRVRERPLATVLETGGQLTLALSGQAPVVATSVALRWLAEVLSDRFVGQADALLSQMLPTPAAQYQALREPGTELVWLPLSQLRVGDRLRLPEGSVVPVDGCVLEGEAWLEPVLPGTTAHPVHPGDAVAAGERLQRGTLELRVEADADHSRLSRLQHQLRQLLAARPVAETPDVSGGLALPLTAAALVLGFTGDRARAAALLQADPQQGPDLARPVAREAALLALARQGLLTTGAEPLQRLARASVLLVEVQGVLSSPRWLLESVESWHGIPEARVRRWLTKLAGAKAEEAASLHLPEDLLREWCSHGTLFRSGTLEVHLADAERLQRVWGLSLDPLVFESPGPPRRVLACIVKGEVVARLVFVSPWRDGLAVALNKLAGLGFVQIALYGRDAPLQLPGAVQIHSHGEASDWLACATEGGQRQALVLHRTLRDLVPPGSLSLSPLDAEGGAHGLLVGDPLTRLIAARQLAQSMERQLRWRDEVAVGVNAALMTLGALRIINPMTTALLHHGTALALLLHSLRMEWSTPTEPESNLEK